MRYWRKTRVNPASGRSPSQPWGPGQPRSAHVTHYKLGQYWATELWVSNALVKESVGGYHRESVLTKVRTHSQTWKMPRVPRNATHGPQASHWSCENPTFCLCLLTFQLGIIIVAISKVFRAVADTEWTINAAIISHALLLLLSIIWYLLNGRGIPTTWVYLGSNAISAFIYTSYPSIYDHLVLYKFMMYSL